MRSNFELRPKTRDPRSETQKPRRLDPSQRWVRPPSYDDFVRAGTRLYSASTRPIPRVDCSRCS